MKILAALGVGVLSQRDDGSTTTSAMPSTKTTTRRPTKPPMTTTPFDMEPSGEYEEDMGDYNYTDKPDYEDDDHHDDHHDEYEKPAGGECSREAMKDWRHAMEKWQKSYKDWEEMMEHHKEHDMGGSYKPDGEGSGWFDWMGDWGIGSGSNDNYDHDDFSGSGDDYYGGSGDMDMNYGDDSGFWSQMGEFLEFLGTEEFCHLLPLAVPDYLEPEMWRDQCLYQQKTQMAYNNLINELMAGMISPSEASSGICSLIAGEIEYMHKNESDFMMYASPILKHFEGSCKCAVKNIINLFSDDLSPMSALTCIAEIAQAVNEFDMYSMEYPDISGGYVNSTVPEWMYNTTIDQFPNATYFLSWWFEEEQQMQEFAAGFPWSIEYLSKAGNTNATEIANAFIYSDDLAQLYKYKIKALGHDDPEEFRGVFAKELYMKLGEGKAKYLLNSNYSFDYADFIDMSGSEAFAGAFGFDLQGVLSLLSMPYESFDMMKWNIITYYETYVNTMNSKFGYVAIPVNHFEEWTSQKWIYYHSVEEINQPGFAEAFVDMHKDEFHQDHETEQEYDSYNSV